MKGIWKYDYLLPVVDERYRITRGEGNTPLIKSRQIGKLLGLENLYFKLENVNPSGSYKDRFAAASIAHVLQGKTKSCFGTSSGNTGAALASYCAAADIECFLIVVEGAPEGKLQQMQVYGANVIQIKGFGKDVHISRLIMETLDGLAKKDNSIVQISAYAHNPIGMSGVQTISYEIAEQLPNVPKQVFSPAGGGGLALALIRGFRIWGDHKTGFEHPKIHCVQPLGNDTIAGALKNGLNNATEIFRSTTSISGLQVPNILDGNDVIRGCRKSGGSGYLVSDDLIYNCQKLLAIEEGIFCEPAGAVALAGVTKAVEEKEINKKDYLICLITGSGFKDPASATKIAKRYSCQQFETPENAFKYIKFQVNNYQKK